MAQIDIDKFVISLMRYFGNNKGIAITLDRCLFSLGLKYVDTPTGGRLERVDQPTMLEKIMWESSEQKPADTDNKFIKMRETKPKDISEFLDRLTTVEQEFLWEHIAKIREMDKEEQKPEERESCEHWSDEQTRIKLLSFVNTWGKAKLSLTGYNRFVNYLEKQGEQKPAEWSEEDKVMLDEIVDFFENGTVKLQHDLSLYASWLKSLRPHITWKPSDVQLDSLYDALNPCDGFYREVLESLYQDLKKLTK